MPKAVATHSAKPYDASARPRKSRGQDKLIFICGIDDCEWNSTDQSTVSRHKWTHLPRSMHPRCDALNHYGKRCGRRYFRLDDYRTHWKKCHKDQEWVNPQARDRFMYLWQEYCEQRNKRQFLTTSSFFQQAPDIALPQVPAMDATSSPAPLPPAADTSAVPTRLVQAAPQVVLVENSLGLFGQDSFALATPLPDANIPFSVLPPSAYNYPAASFAFPSASDYAGYRRFMPVDTGFSSQSSSASTPGVPIPPTEDVFASIGASDQLQARLEPYGSLAPDFQATNEDWSKWLADL